MFPKGRGKVTLQILRLAGDSGCGGGMCTLSEPERDGESICVGISDKDYSCGADVGL